MKQTIQQYLGLPLETPFRERPKQRLYLQLTKLDLRRAKQHEPRQCALAKCGRRMFGTTGAAVFSRVAYFELKDKKGQTYIGKFQATADAKKKIREFDATGVMPEGAVEFRPIAKSHTRKVRTKYQNRSTKAPGSRKYTKRDPLTRMSPHFFEVTGDEAEGHGTN